MSKLTHEILGQIVYNDDMIPGIVKTKDVCGGSARIAGTRIPVWLLVEYRKLGTSESKLLEAYPTLNLSDLTNAWAYYRVRLTEIEQEILENEII